MSNNYVPNLSDLLAGELARAADINTRYGHLVSGFDKLPAPLASGQGFSDPVVVGTPTLGTHAVPKSVMDAVETGVITNRDATAVSAAAAAVSETNAATSETNAAASATAASTAQVAAETAQTGSETAETGNVTAKTSAETAQTASLASQNAAAASATAAALSETNAAAAASGVASNTTAAQTAATNAAASEASATSSQAAAASSATAASTSESAAATSATASATSATASQTAKTASETAQTAAETAQAAALVSQNAAAASVTSAATSETNAASSATASAGSATASAGSATTAAATLVTFEELYLGSKTSAPNFDNQGGALVEGAMYFNSTSNKMFVRTSAAAWTETGSAVNGTSNRSVTVATSNQTTFSITYDVGFVDVYLNGSKLHAGIDFTATNGTTVVLNTGAAAGDIVDMVAYGAFNAVVQVKNPDGGFANSSYTPAQSIDGGTASG